MECSAAPWSTMLGMDTGPVLTRHPTLFVGRRRVPPELWGLWRTVITLVTSHHEDSVEGLIELCPAMFRLPDSFTVVSELKRAVQEVWRSMMVIFLALRVLLGGR